jgi:hypothetical protein
MAAGNARYRPQLGGLLGKRCRLLWGRLVRCGNHTASQARSDTLLQ